MKGVIVMSAGNHAKAVACHAERLRIPATIVMSKNTRNVKVKDTKNFGARVVLSGDNLDETAAHAQQIAESEHLTFVHPYNAVDIIAGQETVALEILQAQPDLDSIVVPVGEDAYQESRPVPDSRDKRRRTESGNPHTPQGTEIQRRVVGRVAFLIDRIENLRNDWFLKIVKLSRGYQ